MLSGKYAIISFLFQIVYAQETIYLQDVDNIVTSTLTNGPALPTGGALAIHQDYNGDVDLYLSSELISSLGSTIEGTCKADSMGCESSIQDVLLAADYDLQSRQVGFLLFAGGILLAAFAHMIIEVYKQDGIVPIRVNLEANIASSIKAAEQAPDVYLAATNEPVVEVPITQVPTAASTITLVPINPSALAGTAVQISVATNGNYMLQIKDQTALTWLQNQAKKPCNGADSKKHKRFSDCAPLFAADAMAALPNDLINFLTIDRIAPLVAGGALAASLQAVFNAGRSIAQLIAFSDDTIIAAAELFLVLFDEALNHQQAIATINTLPSSDFDQTSTATSITSGLCPTGSNAPACQDSTCLGDVTIGTCTSSGTVSGCSCAPIVTPFIYTGNASWLTTQQLILASIVAQGPLYPSRPTCTYDGAPWMSPPLWCECSPPTSSNGLLTFPTLPPSTGIATITSTPTPNCDYTILPASTISPITTTPAPTNIPGEAGIPACAFVSYPDGDLCTEADYCFCDGIAVGFRTYTVDDETITNCNYTIQPTAKDCPPPTTTLPSPSSSPTTTTPSTTQTTLRCNPTDSPNYAMFSRDYALGNLTAVCNTWHDTGLSLGHDSVKDDADVPLEHKASTAGGDGWVGIGITAVWVSAGCNEPAVDFGSVSVESCVQMFLPAMDSCPDFVQPDGQANWKIGGVYHHDCASWSIQGYTS